MSRDDNEFRVRPGRSRDSGAASGRRSQKLAAQVQRAANVLAGYSLGEADLLRRAMGKKDLSKMIQQRKNFVDGCKRVNNIPEKQANDIFDLLEKFAGYGFNKSHSAAYGLISYQTAYLKANYPVEFMAAVLTSEIGHSHLGSKEVESKLVTYMGESQEMGIEILQPDVQKSVDVFSIETPPTEKENPAIRFGLLAVKNVGDGAVAARLSQPTPLLAILIEPSESGRQTLNGTGITRATVSGHHKRRVPVRRIWHEQRQAVCQIVERLV